MTVTGVHHGEWHTMVARSESDAGLATTTHLMCIHGSSPWLNISRGGVGAGEPQQSAMRPWLLM